MAAGNAVRASEISINACLTPDVRAGLELAQVAAWKKLLGELINSAARLRFYPHRVMMFLNLAELTRDYEERRFFLDEARKTLAGFDAIVLGMTADRTYFGVNEDMFRLLQSVISKDRESFDAIATQFSREAWAILRDSASEAGSLSEDIIRLSRFVATDLYERMNKVVSDFSDELGRLAFREKAAAEEAQARLLIYNAELQQAVQAAERERVAAEAANNAKSSFLAHMSHEIRTPLNGLLGMTQAMSFDELPPAQQKRLQIVRQSGEALLSILNGILDLSKIEAGKMELEKAPFDLVALLDAVRDAFLPVADQKDLRLQVSMPPDLGAWRTGDSTRVRQILHNLLGNALKFTAQGVVSLEVEAFGGEGVRFVISDTGIGIDPDHLGAIFEKFSQAESGTTRRFGGTGLGLAICRELAELMSGIVEVRSKPGSGSVFTVDLRLPTCEAQHPSETSNPEAGSELNGSLRVLAAEDNAINQIVLKALLATSGVEPTFASNGREAVDAWLAGAFDLVLMDVQMPIMDGMTAVAQIRAYEAVQGRERTPIIALTANTLTHQVQGYLAAGVDGVLAKPIEIDKLYTAIGKALGEAEVTAA